MTYDVILLVCSTAINIARCDLSTASHIITMENLVRLDADTCRDLGAVAAATMVKKVPNGYYVASFCRQSSAL